MGAPKGRPKPKKSGRQAGTSNKISSDLREMVRRSLDEVGGIEYLKTQAFENPVAYMGLVGKVIPKEVEAKITGEFSVFISKSDLNA